MCRAVVVQHGFVIIKGVLEGEALERAQRAWNSVMEPQWAAWEAERAKGVGFVRAAGGGFAAGTKVARRYFDLKGLFGTLAQSFPRWPSSAFTTPTAAATGGGATVVMADRDG